MIVTPQSIVNLLSTPLENDYKHTLKFQNENAQSTYFLSRIVQSCSEFTYVRQEAYITVPYNRDTLFNVNYCMYKNTGFSNKWFYAFVTKLEYVNENATRIYIELDAFQTWQFNVMFHQSFVVREHISNDTIGANTVDEGLEIGDYIFKGTEPLQLLNNFWYVMIVSDKVQSVTYPADYSKYGAIFDGIYSGLHLHAFKDITQLTVMIMRYETEGKTDAIKGIYCVPHICIPYENVGSYGIVSNTYKGLSISSNYNYTQNNIDGYTPQNNKLYIYPYNIIELTNNMGQSAIYKPELFATFGKAEFEILTNMSNNVSVSCIPKNYQKINTSVEEAIYSADLGIVVSGFPQCAWISDFFANWLAQNSFGNAISVAGTALNMGVGLSTGNPIAIASGALGIASQMNERHLAEITPNQSKGNTSNNNVLSAQNLMGFYINHKTIKKEYAERIDKFFHMFGYKVNQLKIPNINTRPNFNYVETIDINIEGDIPQDDMQKIKSIFNNGVTLWHNTTNFKNYNITNK